MTGLTRRDILTAASAVSALAAADARAEVLADKRPQRLTFSTPAEHVRAYLKLHVSLANETIYHTYVGTLEALMPGHEIVNLVSSTTLLRRQVEVRPEGHHISLWEGTVYHRPGETEPLEEFENPVNGRMVRPFHQREGKGEVLWTDNGPRIRRSDGQWTTIKRDGKRFSLDWSQAGDRIWTSRYASGVYARHPLNAEDWPLEFSGPELLYSQKTTNSGLIGEVGDPAVLNASATYSLSVGMLWWPWLLMGQTPGHLVWNTNGVKISSPDEMSADSRSMFERVHPKLFASGEPWKDRVNLWTEYPKKRKPVETKQSSADSWSLSAKEQTKERLL